MTRKSVFSKFFIVCCMCVFLADIAFGTDDRGIRRKKTEGQSEQRSALVIGNGNYRSAPLRNPVNDARDMSDALRRLGFRVIHKENAGLREMDEAVSAFWKNLRTGGVGLFYYAGHGMQVEGSNYLIPVDATIETESDVKYEAVNAGKVLGKMKDAGNDLNIMILDACRNNRFARGYRSSPSGLAAMDAPKGSLIVFATDKDSVASDGDGRNGIFTGYFLRYMETPGLKLRDVVLKTRVDVVNATGGKQVPAEYSVLLGSFYFAGGSSEVVVPKPREPSFGKLTLDTSPSGAAIYIGGKNMGNTPLSFGKLKPGNYRIRAEMDGHRPEKKTVTIGKGEDAKVTLYLDRIVTTTIVTTTTSIRPEEPDVRLRSQPRTLSDEDCKKMVAEHNFYDKYKNESGDFENDFVKSSDGKTVTDRKTGLMWQQSGSDEGMTYKDAQAYVRKLNSRQFAGHSDWRLPTIEELASLMENREMNGDLHIDPVFDKKQRWCWSADKGASGSAWLANFYYGIVGRLFVDGSSHVRAVRSRTI